MSVSVTNLGIEGIEEIEQIGSGGSSRVYRARQTDLDRVVAIKVINAGQTDDVARRFDRERKAMGRLSIHEGIVPVYTSGVTAYGDPYLIMPFFSNGSLQDQIEMGAMEWETAVGYVDAAAETIAAAHDEDVVHLDLKPANILLTKTGAPRIADFGIAKLGGNLNQTDESNTAVFTPAYSAPETFLDGETGPASDVYGLGATLWALLVGHPPFLTPGEDTNLMAVIGRVVNTPVSDLRHFTPAPICDVIERAMAKHPQNRYQTAREFSQALKAAAVQAGGAGHEDPTVMTGSSLFPAEDNRTRQFQSPGAPEVRPVAGSVQYVPPLNPTPDAPPAPTQPEQSRRLLETSTSVYSSPVGPTPTVHKEPVVDWDSLRIVPILVGIAALALLGGVALWALTQGGDSTATETADVPTTVTTAPASPQTDPSTSTPTSTSAALGSVTGINPAEDSEATVTTVSAAGNDVQTTTTTESTTSTTEDSTSSSSSSSSSSTTTTEPESTTPEAPVNARALWQPDSRSVAISWSAPSGVTPSAYDIFRDGTRLTTVNGSTSYSDSSVVPGEQYLYRLQSVGADSSDVSPQTPPISVSIPNDEPQTPGVPSNPRFVVQTNGSVAITWSAPSGTAPSAYEIFRDGSSLNVVRNGTSFTDNTTQAGETYVYRLRSIGQGDNNNSAQTQAFEVEIPAPEPVAPQPPTNLEATVRANDSVDLRWTAPDAGEDPTAYEVFRDGARLATVSNGVRFNDATTANGETYTYSVRSLGPSSTASARTPTVSVTIPGAEAPLSLTLTPGTVTSDSIMVELEATVCSQFRLSWTDGDNNTSAVTTPADGCVESVEFTIPDLDSDEDYRVIATAETPGGQTAATTPQVITTDP